MQRFIGPILANNFCLFFDVDSNLNIKLKSAAPLFVCYYSFLFAKSFQKFYNRKENSLNREKNLWFATSYLHYASKIGPKNRCVRNVALPWEKTRALTCTLFARGLGLSDIGNFPWYRTREIEVKWSNHFIAVEDKTLPDAFHTKRSCARNENLSHDRFNLLTFTQFVFWIHLSSIASIACALVI